MKAASILIPASLLLAACALEPPKPPHLAPGEKVIPQLDASAIPSAAYQVLYTQLNKQLGDADLRAKQDDRSARYLEVTVTDYVMRRYAERVVTFFAATGDRDAIQSTVKVKDRSTGETLAEFKVNTWSVSATAGGLIQLHVEEILKALTRAN